MRLADDLKEFVELLNSNKVDYIIVGAFALGYHKLPRYTGDLDIFVSNSLENAQRILAVLNQFGFGSLELTVSDFQSKDTVVQLGMPPNRIDLLTFISGVSYADAALEAELGAIDGIPVRFLSLRHLIENKRATGRPKDLADIEAIEKRNGRNDSY